MGRNENIAVFEDTKMICTTDSKVKESIAQAIKGQRILFEHDEISVESRDLYEEPARFVISKKRTLEAASFYKGRHVAVHNFASATSPGGGVVNGANAQEECICRSSGLFFCLNTYDAWKGFYGPHRNAGDPLHNGDIIYTPGITVFKTDTAVPKLMQEADWYDVDVITCAAPNLRENPTNRFNPADGNGPVKIKDRELLAIHETRLRRILDAAVAGGCDTVVLGAFGCGAFRNNPEVVALANRNVVKDYLHAFKNIEYAVYCSPGNDANFRVFERVLKVYCS